MEVRRRVCLIVVTVLAGCAGPGTVVERGTDVGGQGGQPSPPATAGTEPDGEPGAEAAAASRCEDLERQPPVDGPLSDDEEVAAAQRARAFYGLPSDEVTVRAVLAATDEQDWVYPFPHDDAELEELDGRSARSIDTGAVHEWVTAEAAEDYAGMWKEHDDGDVLVVAFADRVAEHRGTLQERWGDDVRVVEAVHPYVELEALQRRITGDMAGQPTARPAGSVYAPPGTLLHSGIRDDLNRVAVGVVGGEDGVLVAVTERYGADRICLEVRVAPDPLDYDGPLRPLLKAEGWRDGLHERTDAFALMEIAYDRDTAELAWAANVPGGLPGEAGDPARPGVYGTLDDVDFDTQAVVVWSSGESGSCPGWLAGVTTTRDGEVEVETRSTGLGGCQADYNPYRMVVAVDRDRLPAVDDLPIDSGRPSTVVVAYPLQR